MQQFESNTDASTGLIPQGSREKDFWDEALNSQKLLFPLIHKNSRSVDFSSCCRTSLLNLNIFLLSYKSSPSFIVPAPEIPEQLNVNLVFILLMPLWVLALLLPAFYSRGNQGRGNWNTWSAAVGFTRWSLHYSLIIEKPNVTNSWTTDSSIETRTVFLANTQNGISHCFTHHDNSFDALREAGGENTIINIWGKYLWGLWQQTWDS